MKIKKLLTLATAIIMSMVLAIPAYATGEEDIFDKIDEVYNDPDATVCDVIRVTNPELYAAMTEEQRADFAAINYQESKANAGMTPQYIIWGHALVPRLNCNTKGKIKYYVNFASSSLGGTSDCSLIGLTCTITDLTDDERIKFDSTSAYNTDECSLDGTISGAISGHIYENSCEAYGYDPNGLPFVFYESCTATGK